MDKEKVGALIDGVYAIAMTLLALEISKIEPGDGWQVRTRVQ